MAFRVMPLLRLILEMSALAREEERARTMLALLESAKLASCW